MKQIILIGFCAVLLVNLFAVLVFSGYNWFNWGVVTLVLTLNAALAYAVASSTVMKDAFKISLCSLFSLFTLGEVVCGIIAPEAFEDNGYLVAIYIGLTLQVLIAVVAYFVSKTNQPR